MEKQMIIITNCHLTATRRKAIRAGYEWCVENGKTACRVNTFSIAFSMEKNVGRIVGRGDDSLGSPYFGFCIDKSQKAAAQRALDALEAARGAIRSIQMRLMMKGALKETDEALEADYVAATEAYNKMRKEYFVVTAAEAEAAETETEAAETTEAETTEAAEKAGGGLTLLIQASQPADYMASKWHFNTFCPPPKSRQRNNHNFRRRQEEAALLPCQVFA